MSRVVTIMQRRLDEIVSNRVQKALYMCNRNDIELSRNRIREQWLMRKRSDPETLAALEKALMEGDGSRPPLYQWMLANHDELVDLFAGARPPWERLTEAFSDLGFRNKNGTALRAETVRQTWYRARKAYAKMAKSRSMRQPLRIEPPTLTGSAVTPVVREIQPEPVRSQETKSALEDLNRALMKRSGQLPDSI